MSKLLGFTAFAVFVAAAIAIASLVLNILILTRVSNINNNIPINETNPTTSPTARPSPMLTDTPSIYTTLPANNINNNTYCPNIGPAGTSQPYQQASAYLLNGLDQSVDPCEDFYAFTCNKFLAQVNLTDGMGRLGTYDEAQVIVNNQTALSLKAVDINDEAKWSATERITKAALDACVINSQLTSSIDKSKQIYNDIMTWFGGVPFLGGKLTQDSASIWGTVGLIEQTHALGTLLSSWVSVDYKNVSQNALYISQPALSMPRDFYVLPQFVDKLNGRAQVIEEVMTQFAKDLMPTFDSDSVTKASQAVANFEVQIAMASWPDDEMRNYDQQYNAYKLDTLNKAYPSIGWSTYLANLTSSVEKAADVFSNQVVISQPSYFAWLNAIFAGNSVDRDTVVNYIITQLLFDDAGFLGGSFKNIAQQSGYVPYAQRRGRGVTRVGRRYTRKFDDQDDPAIDCIDLIMAYMPYGPGYVYVKGQTKRDDVVKDVTHQTDLVIKNFLEMMNSTDWMSADSKKAAQNKADNLYKNYGWPKELFGDFKSSTNIDKYHSDYMPILEAFKKDNNDYYTILKVLKTGLENREAFRLLTEKADRSNFLQSPAMVNAWYQPERNSITFPYAIWNPPYYNIDYPQAYNYAGQGGTGGHELTHGFDDEGVQFGWDGSLTGCTWNQCGWMDTDSKIGFTGMAQCVVTQYSTQCCPEKAGNVHCANGATTQGENIADLGGQQAAYNAYREYINDEKKQEELRLPGLEQYTPNQIFWITYGYSWCMKQSDKNLVNQLLTNPHAPGSCRTNQVMQDIPSFGQDFGCKQGSPMYPTPDKRCKVWVGY